MSRRSRAVGFLALALVAAALAAGIADSYGSKVARGYGPLRDVVIATRALPGGKPVAPAVAADDLEARRVPVKFVPAGALRSPAQAIGLVPAVDLSAGSYLLASQLHPPTSGRSPAIGAHRQPVEISVSGADALLATGTAERGARVDVVVTAEPSAAGPGKTYVAATAVPLLGLGPGADGPGPGGTAAATLALTREQALRLIAAESFARKLTLLLAG
jgi:Flp pilus assembly protein CpaB